MPRIQTIAGMPQTKLLIAELMLIMVSICSPYAEKSKTGKRKENVNVSE
jgi:hypothetical protein